MQGDEQQVVAAQAPKPRIVQYDRRRYSIRLESVFWKFLEFLAERRGMRLGRYIAGLAGSYRGNNLSSYLRVVCMLEAERKVAESSRAHHFLFSQVKCLDPREAVSAPPVNGVVRQNAAYTCAPVRAKSVQFVPPAFARSASSLRPHIAGDLAEWLADLYFGRGQTILLERERIKRKTVEQHRKSAA